MIKADVSSRDYNAEYKDGARKYAYEFDAVLRHYMMRALDPFLPRGKALELGCYTGDVTELLAARYEDLTVVEASEELVHAARARLGRRATFRLGTFEEIDLTDRYDAVTDAERAHGHRRTYRLDTLERDVRAAGLQVVHSGGVFFKPLANYQFDKLLGGDVISDGYLEGCYRLGLHYPDLCASVYAVCERVVPKA